MAFRGIERHFQILDLFQIVVVVVGGGGGDVEGMVVAALVFHGDIVVVDYLVDDVTVVFQQVVAGDGVEVDFQAVVVAVAAAVVCGYRIAADNRSDDDAVVGCRSPPCLPMLPSSTFRTNCRPI